MAANKRNGRMVSLFIPKCTPNNIISLLSVPPLTGAEPSPKHQHLGLNSSVPGPLRNTSVPTNNVCFGNIFGMPNHGLFVCFLKQGFTLWPWLVWNSQSRTVQSQSHRVCLPSAKTEGGKPSAWASIDICSSLLPPL